MPHSLTIEPASPDHLVPALRLVFQYLAEDERAARVANALTLMCQNALDPRGVLTACRRSRLVGALVCQRLAGASGLLWPPQVSTGAEREEVEDALVQSACAWIRAGGARLAQAIVRPEETPLAKPFERNGFVHVTGLWYLRRPVDEDLDDRLFPETAAGQSVTFRNFPQCDRVLFQQTLMRTYEGTLDCPELNGVRGPEDILAGHMDQGKHDSTLWWLAFQESRPVGVLLVTSMPEWDALDISYLGVVPEARGRGLGHIMAARSLSEAQTRGVKQVTLAVDRRNRPAWNIYREIGFEPHEEREVYLRIWPA
jgi:ribosomal protein S18 acetylase RimI-like enzyme